MVTYFTNKVHLAKERKITFNGNMLLSVIFIIIAYLLGSLSSAIIYCRLAGLPDPRTQGSKNPGTTNVLRLGGKKAAAITLLGDMLKGFIPVLFASAFTLNHLTLGLVALAAFIGHLFPVFFKFQGGKGVATFFGVLLALNWLLGIIALATWLITAFLFRYSSLAALVAAGLTPLYCLFLGLTHYLPVITLIALILIGFHHENIKSLLQGKEDKIKLG